MTRSLVVVTCYKDLWQLEVMFKSMDKYLEPCKFVIVVNEEDNTYWDKWWDERQNLISNHSTKVYWKKDFIPEDLSHWPAYNSGWLTQQILKIVICEKVETEEYVIVDSKNFFIRPGKLEDIKQQGETIEAMDSLWVSYIVSKFNSSLKDINCKLTPSVTPFIFNTNYTRKLVEYFGGNKEFANWYLMVNYNIRKSKIDERTVNNYGIENALDTIRKYFIQRLLFVSEFYLYELFCKIILKDFNSGNPNHINKFFIPDGYAQEEWTKLYHERPEILIGKIHRNDLKIMDKKEIYDFYNFFGIETGPYMKKIIFSIHVDIPSDKLDNPGWWENGVQVTTDKSEFAKKQFNRFRDRIIQRHKGYANLIHADYVLHEWDEEYEDFCEMFRTQYSQISEYDIINFYKHWLMKKYAEDYDLICYFDFDVVPVTRDDIFDAHDPLNYFCCAESNREAIQGKIVDSRDYNHCIRNPASKYWNAHAMLAEEGYEPDTDVFNTGIMIASKETISKMDYFGKFKEVLEYMSKLKYDTDSMYPPNIQRIFNYDNETVFAYKRVVNDVPIQYIDDKWHSRVLNNKVDPDAKVYHVINKEFAVVFER